MAKKDVKRLGGSFLIALGTPFVVALLLLPLRVSSHWWETFYVLFLGPLSILDLAVVVYPAIIIRAILLIARLAIQLRIANAKKGYWKINVIFVLLWTLVGLVVGAVLIQTG